MATYITLYNYQGPIKGGGPDRFKKVQEVLETGGGKFLQVWGLLGSYDIVSVGEFPDNHCAMKCIAKVGNIINATTHTMPAIERDDFLQILTEL
ncbi:MAG: GYD domain-containing protein [SAR324 cluster bacterium]|nr:GYD domain-containing protein [SAR324 cluster bacterium]